MNKQTNEATLPYINGNVGKIGNGGGHISTRCLFHSIVTHFRQFGHHFKYFTLYVIVFLHSSVRLENFLNILRYIPAAM